VLLPLDDPVSAPVRPASARLLLPDVPLLDEADPAAPLPALSPLIDEHPPANAAIATAAIAIPVCVFIS